MKRLLLIVCLVSGLTPVMFARSAWFHRGQESKLLLCTYHAYRTEQDAKHGSKGFAAYQAYRTAHHCGGLLTQVKKRKR